METTTPDRGPHRFGTTPAEQIQAAFERLRPFTFDGLAMDIHHKESALISARRGESDINAYDATVALELSRSRMAVSLLGEGALMTLLDSLAKTGADDDAAFFMRNGLLEALGLPEE